MYIVQAALGYPPRLARQEILEEEHTQLDHVEDVMPKCRRIVEIAYIGIDGSDVRQVLDAIMTEARGAGH